MYVCMHAYKLNNQQSKSFSQQSKFAVSFIHAFKLRNLFIAIQFYISLLEF